MGLFPARKPGHEAGDPRARTHHFRRRGGPFGSFRPGPMENIPAYSRRKKGTEKITYLSPSSSRSSRAPMASSSTRSRSCRSCGRWRVSPMAKPILFRRAISQEQTPINWRPSKTSSSPAALKTAKIGHRREGLRLDLQIRRLWLQQIPRGLLCRFTCQMAYLKKHFPKEFYCAILDSMSPSRPQIQRHDERDQGDRTSLGRPRRQPERVRLHRRRGPLRFPLSGIKGLQVRLRPFPFRRTGGKRPFKRSLRLRRTDEKVRAVPPDSL
jgi:DNA polymerase-3 subunit alpha